MRKNFIIYSIIWLLMLIVFNAIAFIAPGWSFIAQYIPNCPPIEKYTAGFWIGYAFINLALIGNLAFTSIGYLGKKGSKIFLNVSLLKVCFTTLGVTFFIGSLCMIFNILPYWVGGIVCLLILLINFIAVMKTKVAINVVSEVENNVKYETSFIYTMREESESLYASAMNLEHEGVCKNVRDAFKYCDPMSSQQLDSVNAEIASQFNILKEAVKNQKAEEINQAANVLIALISERNNKCKRLK